MLRPLLLIVALASGAALPNTPAPAVTEAADADIYQWPGDWRDEHGAAVSLASWSGQTVLLTMAYSSCREVCSYTLKRLEAEQRSAERSGRPVQVVVISYDPAQDSPATWSNYRQHHHLTRADWHFLTGSTEATARFARTLNFPYWQYDEHVVHDFQILLVGPDGRVRSRLDWSNRGEDLFATDRLESKGP